LKTKNKQKYWLIEQKVAFKSYCDREKYQKQNLKICEAKCEIGKKLRSTMRSDFCLAFSSNLFQLYHPCNPLGSISLKISNSQLQTFKFVISLFLHENTINSPTPKNPFLTIFDYKTETP
jgi:hypothetical protein